MFLFFVFCKCCFLPHSSVSLTLLPRLLPFIYHFFFVLTVFFYCITFWPLLSTSALLDSFTFSCLWVFSMATLNAFSLILLFALYSYDVEAYVRCCVHFTNCHSVTAASFTLLHFLKDFWSCVCLCCLTAFLHSWLRVVFLGICVKNVSVVGKINSLLLNQEGRTFSSPLFLQ